MSQVVIIVWSVQKAPVLHVSWLSVHFVFKESTSIQEDRDYIIILAFTAVAILLSSFQSTKHLLFLNQSK